MHTATAMGLLKIHLRHAVRQKKKERNQNFQKRHIAKEGLAPSPWKTWTCRGKEKETFRSCHGACSWVCESSSVMETVLGLWNTELASPPTTGILTFSLKGHQSFHVFTSAFNASRKVSRRMKRRDAREKKEEREGERQDLDMDRGEAGLWEIQDQKEKKTKAISS